MDKYESTFADFSAKHEKFIVVYTGEENAETGESWCPDCQEAKPVIMKVLLGQCKEKGLAWFICYVGDRPQ